MRAETHAAETKTYVVRNGGYYLEVLGGQCVARFKQAYKIRLLASARFVAKHPPGRTIHEVTYGLRWFTSDGKAHEYISTGRTHFTLLRSAAARAPTARAALDLLTRSFALKTQGVQSFTCNMWTPNDGGFKVVRFLKRVK